MTEHTLGTWHFNGVELYQDDTWLGDFSSILLDSNTPKIKRLIVAVPDLLAACEEAISWADNVLWPDEMAPEWVILIEAAIAKAKGETE